MLFAAYMPEGPSIVLAKEAAASFIGKKVIAVSGNTTIDKERALAKKVVDLKSWGKHFLICFNGFTFRIHFLLFGSYLVNETKEQAVRLQLAFANGELNLYSCSIKILEGDINTYYDWTADVMNDSWDRKKAIAKLRDMPEAMICDALLNQDVFAGVGNIIKNEVLYKLYVHPESLVGKIPAAILRKIVDEARDYSFDFLKWKRNYELKKHWLAHTKLVCLRCQLPFTKKYLGKTNRRSFFCTNCQVLYA
jgi:endonuclease-8